MRLHSTDRLEKAQSPGGRLQEGDVPGAAGREAGQHVVGGGGCFMWLWPTYSIDTGSPKHARPATHLKPQSKPLLKSGRSPFFNVAPAVNRGPSKRAGAGANILLPTSPPHTHSQRPPSRVNPQHWSSRHA